MFELANRHQVCCQWAKSRHNVGYKRKGNYAESEKRCGCEVGAQDVQCDGGIHARCAKSSNGLGHGYGSRGSGATCSGAASDCGQSVCEGRASGWLGPVATKVPV